MKSCPQSRHGKVWQMICQDWVDDGLKYGVERKTKLFTVEKLVTEPVGILWSWTWLFYDMQCTRRSNTNFTMLLAKQLVLMVSLLC